MITFCGYSGAEHLAWECNTRVEVAVGEKVLNGKSFLTDTEATAAKRRARTNRQTFAAN